MKKNYIAPQIMVQNIELAGIMASSIVIDAVTEGDSALSNDFKNVNFWGEEENADQ